MKKVALFSKEYPPHVYGGAGVHVEYLARALAKSVDVEMRCFGDQHIDDGRLTVRGYPQWDETKQNTDPRFVGAIDAYARSLVMAKDRLDAELVHCHTWYTDMGGLIAAKLWGVPYVLTIHSLEPLRPWKVEQLGNGYHLSAWMERTAIDRAGGRDRRRLQGNQGRRAAAVRRRARARPRHPQRHRPRRVQGGGRPPTFSPAGESIRAGRSCCLSAASRGRRASSISSRRSRRSIPTCRSCCAPGRRTRRRSGAEMEAAFAKAAAGRPGLVWIREMLPRADVIQLYTHAGGVLLPVGVRAVRHHQPRGDGLRHRRRRLERRRHSRGGGAGGRPDCSSTSG